MVTRRKPFDPGARSDMGTGGRRVTCVAFVRGDCARLGGAMCPWSLLCGRWRAPGRRVRLMGHPLAADPSLLAPVDTVA
jgi:hypothetical protein